MRNVLVNRAFLKVMNKFQYFSECILNVMLSVLSTLIFVASIWTIITNWEDNFIMVGYAICFLLASITLGGLCIFNIKNFLKRNKKATA